MSYSDGDLDSLTQFTATPPRYVGGYRMGSFHFGGFTVKPSAWHRFWIRVCLGWAWEDAP